MPRDIHVRLARLVARRSGAPEPDDFVSAYGGAHGSATSQWNGIRTPTKAQAKAGNYALGTVNWHGLTLKIENPAHTVREGEGEDGKSWRSVMMAHYGYIAGTRGADGDEVDVFLGPYPESDSAWILNQRNATGGFDEHKVLAGFHTAAAAEDAYRLSYERGWDRYAAPIPVTLDQLRWWLRNADTSREFTSDLVPETAMSDTAVLPTPELPRVLWDSAANPLSGHTLASVLYAIRANDGRDGLVLDPMSMADITEGAEVVALDALVTEAGKLKPKMAALMRIMEAAGGDIKPVALQMSDLLRRYGGVHVAALFELSDGQTITAWFHNPDLTPAKFGPADMLVSWKWMLNKKDVTIVVAPESGRDLDLREVARRLMRLADKNSAAFSKANAKRAATMAEIQGLKDTLADRQATLQRLMSQIEVEKVAAGDRQAAAADPLNIAKGIVSSVSAELGGTLAEWAPAGPEIAGRWERSSLVINGETLRIGVSGGGVIQINGDPFTKSDRAMITDAQTFRRAVLEYAPIYNQRVIYAEGHAIGFAAGEAGDAFLPSDSTEYTAAAAKYTEFPGVVTWLREGFNDGFDAGRAKRLAAEEDARKAAEEQAMADKAAADEEKAPAESAETKFLVDVKAGAHDALALGELLDKIEAAVNKLNADGLLSGDVDAAASAAVVHWAELEAKANG